MRTTCFSEHAESISLLTKYLLSNEKNWDFVQNYASVCAETQKCTPHQIWSFMLEHMVYWYCGFLWKTFWQKYICFYRMVDFGSNEFAFYRYKPKASMLYESLCFFFPPNGNLSLGLDLLRRVHVTLDSRSDAGSIWSVVVCSFMDDYGTQQLHYYYSSDIQICGAIVEKSTNFLFI